MASVAPLIWSVVVWTVVTADRESELESPGAQGAAGRWSAKDPSPERVDSRGAALDLLSSGELKTTGQKWSTEEYHTLSSLTQSPPSGGEDVGTVEDNVAAPPPVPAKVDLYPALTTDSPPYVARGRYVVRNPYMYRGAGGRAAGYSNDNHNVDITNNDRRPEYSLNDPNAIPMWNSYYPGHRQWKKYGPVIMETDVSPTDGGNNVGYSGYDNSVDYSTISASNNNYEVDNSYKGQNGIVAADGGNGGLVGWYNEPPPAPTRTTSVAAEVRHPGHKMTLDVQKFSVLALVKIGLAKLKVLTVLKFLALLSVKMKVLAMVKMFVFAKFAVLGKLVKLFVLPFLPNLLTWLRNAAMMQLNPGMAMNMNMNMMPGDMSGSGGNRAQLSRNDSATEAVLKRSTNFNDERFTAVDYDSIPSNIFQFVASIQTAKCVDNMACRVAGTKQPSFRSMWVNWILSSLVSYIPNRKIKSYMSTFEEVSDYRLENIFSNPSPEEWLKWCDDRYSCEEETTNNN